jgi:predicted LPLAT superfamily acyltransferase
VNPPTPQPSSQRWTGRSLGGGLLFRVCAFLLPFVGARGAWVGSYVIGAGFLLRGGRRQYHILDYWRRLRPGTSGLGLLFRCWRHYASFGRILCDRMLVFLRPNRYRFEYVNGEGLRETVNARRGCILLSAHVGNWELLGFWLRNLVQGGNTVYLVMVRDDLPQVQSFVDERMRGSHITVIDPKDGLAASLAVAKAISEGHPVCMLGDRVFGEQAGAEAAFLGGAARFPLGPFQTAAITGAPIFTAFLMKVGLRDYRLEVDSAWSLGTPPRGAQRDAAVRQALDRWTQRLEEQVRRYPFQWHNFFAFWSGDRAAGPKP